MRRQGDGAAPGPARYAESAVYDGWSGLDVHFADLSERENDLNWMLPADMLFKDHDILELFDPAATASKTPTTTTTASLTLATRVNEVPTPAHAR